jgi:hypothetical protein
VVGERDGGGLAGVEGATQVGQGPLVPGAHSITRGTRYRPWSTAGATRW